MKRQGNFSKAIEELLSGKIAESPQPEIIEPLAPERKPESESGSDKEAVVTQDMIIRGSIEVKANMIVEGTILGDVASSGDVLLKGKVEGNLAAHSLTIEGGTVVGDVDAKSRVVITEGSRVAGNVRGAQIEVNGIVQGNLESKEKIRLNQNAAIEGDVSAFGLSMHEGAALKGKVTIQKANS